MNKSRGPLIRRPIGLATLLAIAMLLTSQGVAAAQEPGPSNTITDVPGLKVGHETRTTDGYHTGTTVILAEDGATTGYSTQGGLPGTILTDYLNPGGLLTETHGISLSGGSVFGLETAAGVTRWLDEHGHGYSFGPGVVPVVAGAILFDLGRFGSDFFKRPDAEFGYLGAEAATTDPVEIGDVGAGTGAAVALGSASVTLSNGFTVGAIAAVNPAGSPINPDTCLPYALFLELDNEFNLAEPTPNECPQTQGSSAAKSDRNTQQPGLHATTIAVVATDAPLNQTELQRMALVSNSGLARSIRPIHSLGDGDTVFSMATTSPSNDLTPDVLQGLYDAAADALGRAVVHAVLADSSPDSYCNEYPSACRFRDGPQQSGAAFTPGSDVDFTVGLTSDGAAAGDQRMSREPWPFLILVGVFALAVVVAWRRRSRHLSS